MKYRYPKLADSTELTYNEHLEMYCVNDYVYDTDILISEEEYRIISSLDGYTDPYSIDSRLTERQRRRLLAKFENEHLLMFGIVRKLGGFNYVIPLVKFGNRDGWRRADSDVRIGCFVADRLLMTVFLPVLIAGLLIMMNTQTSDDGIITGMIIGILTGMILHETGHAVSGIAHGAVLYESGLFFKLILPGAYVSMNTDPVRNYRHRAQIFAAGIETNFLLAGIYFALCAVSYRLSGALMAAGVSNCMLGVMNMMLCAGLDGEKIFCSLMHDQDLASDALWVISDRQTRKELRQQGLVGYCKVAASYIFSAAQLSMVVYFISVIVEVVICLKDAIMSS